MRLGAPGAEMPAARIDDRTYVDLSEAGVRCTDERSSVTGWCSRPARRIIGWRAATSMRTDLVLDTIEQPIWTRRREGVTDLAGLRHHHDNRSIRLDRLHRTPRRRRHRRLRRRGRRRAGQHPGRVGHRAVQDRTGRRHGPWRTVEHVEAATLKWVDWFNRHRLLEVNGDLPPVELENAHYRHTTCLTEAG
jgi:putative transposase